MNGFKKLINDKITLIKNSGKEIKDIDASVQKNKIIILDEKLPFEEGDLITRKLPNGTLEEYKIIDTGFQDSPFPDKIPSHFNLTVEKSSSITKNKVAPIINHFHGDVKGSQIQQNTTNSSQNIEINYLEKLEEELKKTEPNKSKIKEYLEKIGKLEIKLTPTIITLLSQVL